jgi:predicted PurR-regulated permease PerM
VAEDGWGWIVNSIWRKISSQIQELRYSIRAIAQNATQTTTQTATSASSALVSLFFLSLPNFGAITLHIAKTNQMEPAEFHI